MTAKEKKTAENIQEQGTVQANQAVTRPNPRQKRFVEEGVTTGYAGSFNIGVGQDEVVFIFGNPSIDPNVVRIESKVAVSLRTAKRIAISLGDIIRRYESQKGVIDIASHEPIPVKKTLDA